MTSVSDYDLKLGGKRALITGAAGGIGWATAQAFAQMGTRVAIADVRADRLNELLPQLPGIGHIALPFDLADATACERAVENAADGLVGLDVVVNAGAILQRQSLTDVSADALRAVTAINMWGPFFIARAAAQHMARSGGGCILLMSSQAAYTGGFIGSTVYAMTKAALSPLIKALAREYGAQGVRVNGVAPGVIDTPMIHDGVSGQALVQLLETIPMRRIGLPEELALCCLFLASPAAQYITGQMLHVNGGQLMV